jgi:predicted permease
MRIERWLYTLPLRIRSLFRRDEVEEELAEEIRDHIERQTEANLAAGMAPGDARTAALREFGGVERRKEEVRDARGVDVIEHLGKDVRFAARMLRKSPVFTTVAVLTLALGIGANTAIFGVVQSVLLRPVPYAHADRIVAVFETDTHGNLVGLSKLDFQDWRRASTSFAHLAAVGRFGVKIKDGGYAESAQVSPELFEVLGVPPMLGTAFTNTNQNAVLSEGFWRRQYGGAPDVVGKTIVIDDTARVITGVMPARFDFPHGTQLWIPQDMIPRVKVARTIRFWQIVADLKPGVTIAAAQSELSSVAIHLAGVYPTTNAGVGARVMELEESLTGRVKPTLVLLIVIAGLVLLLACANLANLMLVRGVTRRRELTLRAALGATMGRLQRQLLTECLLLSATGAALGLPLALWCNRLMRSTPELSSLPFEVRVSDSAVFTFAALMTVVTTLIFGMVPAIRASRVDVVTNLKETGARGATALGLSGVLISGEIALATLLLVGATLTVRSLARLEGESLGFNPDQLVIVRANIFSPTYDRTAWLAREPELLASVRRVNGVASAAYVDSPPFAGRGGATSVFIEGEPAGDRAAWHQAIPHTVSDGYFRTLGVAVRDGRDFVAADDRAAPEVVVNESFAKQYLSWRDPIGAQVALPELDSALRSAHQRGEDVWATVIGVVADVREVELGIPPQPTAYFYMGQHPDWLQATILVRTSVQPLATSQALMAAAGVNSGATASLQAVNDLAMRSVVAPRVRAFVLSAFAALALVLAAIGVYGVTAHVTAQRTAEIGIRMALGARSAQVLVAVSGRIVRFTLAGLAIGMVVALASSRLIGAFLYGIGPSDLAAYAAAGVLATGIAALAAWIPARRATRIDPTEALRAE